MSAALSAFKAKPLYYISLFLVLLGSLNWLSIGVQRYNFIDMNFGSSNQMWYIMIGLGGLYMSYCKLKWML